MIDKDMEEKIYDCLIKMKNGTSKEKSIAFECIGILGNESLNMDLNDRLKLVEKMINMTTDKSTEKKFTKKDDL